MDAIVETRRGKLRGERRDGTFAFKGVRFAAPPFGANRLLSPQPVEPWRGVCDALAFGPKSPQVEYPPGIAEGIPELVGSGEDCLTLNIWTPSIGARLPVMVWIPGGMFEFHATGATPFYEGSRFARDGVVCVTIGYRVGAEGFLYLPNSVANLGLLDQIAALEWVRENIAAFGGDPGNVTIFGESAGAMSVATLLAMPGAKGALPPCHRGERKHSDGQFGGDGGADGSAPRRAAGRQGDERSDRSNIAGRSAPGTDKTPRRSSCTPRPGLLG